MTSRPTERPNLHLNPIVTGETPIPLFQKKIRRHLPVVAAVAAVSLMSAGALAQTQTKPITNEVAKLLASDGASGDRFGLAVAISNDTAVVGASGDDDNGYNAGAAYIFDLDDDADMNEDADLDGDGMVDAQDMSSLLSQWGARGGPADLNKDGAVNGADLAILLARWG